MIGLILCGGQSSRMGNDKGLLQSDSNTWAQAAANKLIKLQLSIKVSVNKNQYTSYAELFPPDDLIIDDISLRLKGPLLGLLSTHLRYPTETIFVLACDMPLMESFLLKELLVAYNEHSTPDAFVFTYNNESEPLCGIYKPAGLALVLSMYQSNQLAKHSMKFMLDHISPFTIPIAEKNKKFFFNANTHAELNGL